MYISKIIFSCFWLTIADIFTIIFAKLGNNLPPNSVKTKKRLHNSKKDIPRLFDEWQTIPELWPTIRSEVDERRELGQFGLTSSAIGLYGSISFFSLQKL